MQGIPIAFVAALAGLLVASKEPLNRALSVLRGIEFIILPDKGVKQFSIPDKLLRDKAKSIKTELIETLKFVTDNQTLAGLPYLNLFQLLWTTFVTGLLSALICVILGFLPVPSLSHQVDLFVLPFLIAWLLFVRLGIVSSFNRPLHARFALTYALAWGILSFVVLRKMTIGVFDIRPVILSVFSVPGLALDISIACAIAVVAAALATPMLYELFAHQLLTGIGPRILHFQFAIEYYVKQCRTKVYSISQTVHMLTGVLPTVLIFGLPHVRPFNLELPIVLIFLVLEGAIALFRLISVHRNVQLCQLNSLYSLALFDKSRSVQAGKFAQATVERSLNLMPVSGLALSLQPMMILFAVCTTLVSFVMSGLFSVALRQASLFVIMLSDLLFLGYHIVAMFLAPDE